MSVHIDLGNDFSLDDTKPLLEPMLTNDQSFVALTWGNYIENAQSIYLSLRAVQI